MGEIRRKVQEGGPGSGFFGHAGRMGQQGGSAPSGAGSASPRDEGGFKRGFSKWSEKYAKNPPKVRSSSLEKRLGSANITALTKGIGSIKRYTPKTARAKEHMGRIAAIRAFHKGG